MNKTTNRKRPPKVELPPKLICDECCELIGNCLTEAFEAQNNPNIVVYCKDYQMLIVATIGEDYGISTWTILGPMTREHAERQVSMAASGEYAIVRRDGALVEKPTDASSLN